MRWLCVLRGGGSQLPSYTTRNYLVRALSSMNLLGALTSYDNSLV